MTKQYLRWTGLLWFTTFDAKDTGLLQGDLGRSMELERPVNAVIGDRILLTLVVSVATILLTWVLAVPIGIYSAVRQYSAGDYALTLLGFLGMSVPGFLLALVLMYFSHRLFGLAPSGLFSPEFATVPGWSWAKFADLLKHLWLPTVVLGLGGTAGMIRVMRANLLDELRKPYVVTARAKGASELRLLLKYPVRLALNPFISGIGNLFPALISGGAIVAIVLSLPLVGPVMVNALMSEDVYLAGSMLMVMSVLSVFGTLVSDLLLLSLDPRIRYEGGAR
jgi:ABC-type dipeptide/oligopeptide/nickel transport system permease component